MTIIGKVDIEAIKLRDEKFILDNLTDERVLLFGLSEKIVSDTTRQFGFGQRPAIYGLSEFISFTGEIVLHRKQRLFGVSSDAALRLASKGLIVPVQPITDGSGSSLDRLWLTPERAKRYVNYCPEYIRPVL